MSADAEGYLTVATSRLEYRATFVANSIHDVACLCVLWQQVTIEATIPLGKPSM